MPAVFIDFETTGVAAIKEFCISTHQGVVAVFGNGSQEGAMEGVELPTPAGLKGQEEGEGVHPLSIIDYTE